MGKPSRQKGITAEREVVKVASSVSKCPCCKIYVTPLSRRIPLSGATDFAKGDVQIAWNGNPVLFQTYEIKVRAKLGTLYKWLGDNDGLILREQSNTNRGRDWLLVVRLKEGR